jgi:hypothetical protein
LFDATMWNTDRTLTNPKALWFHRTLVAIDHGRAMYSIEQTDETGLGPDFSTQRGQADWRKHIVFRALARRFRKGRIDAGLFDDFRSQVQGLTDGVLSGLSSRWPAGLDIGGMKGEIIRFLKTRRETYGQIEERVRYALQNG